jgi:hypothetical protein
LGFRFTGIECKKKKKEKKSEAGGDLVQVISLKGYIGGI